MNATERASFLRMLRPPDGYRFGAGLATTYSLELDTLIAALLALAGAKQVEDPAAALDALLEIGATFRVFANRGRVKLGRGVPAPLLALLDGLLCEVNLAASFHPKVWVLEFDPIAGTGGGASRRYRVLCTSRNLTAARTWELAACFDGETGPRGARDTLAQGVASFVQRCVDEHARAAPLAAMARRLAAVRFSVDRRLAATRTLLWQWTGEPARAEQAIALPTRARRALVLSPFLDEKFLRKAAAAKRLSVISTQTAFDKLDRTFLGDLEKNPGVRLNVVRRRDAMDGVEPLELHAKLVAWESGRDRVTLLGSANGTSRGFGLGAAKTRNVEAMVRLRPGISIDRFEREFLKQPWVSVYERTKGAIADPPGERASNVLGQLAKDLVVEGEWEEARGELLLRARLVRRTTTLAAEEASATLRPAWLEPESSASLAAALGAGVWFSAPDPAVVARFAALRLELDGHGAEAVLEIALELPAGRDAAARRILLAAASPAALLRGALGLVRGPSGGGAPGGGRRADGEAPPGTAPEKPHQEEGAPEDVPTLEEVLRACVDSPRFVVKLRSLVEARPDVAALLPYWSVLDRVLASRENS